MRNTIRIGLLLAMTAFAAPGAEAQPPVIGGFTPAGGPPGTLVKIIGEGLEPLVAVHFGEVPATDFYVVSSRHIKAWVPEGAVTAPIKVETPGGIATSPKPFVIPFEPEGSELARLAPPLPNPVSLEAVLQFSVPVRTRTRLVLFDLSGRVVRTLEDAVLDAGVYERRWDARDHRGERARAGLYFVTLDLGARRLTRRLVLVP